MTKEQMVKVMEYFQTVYPTFYEGKDVRDVLMVWFDAFGGEDPAVINMAAKNHVRAKRYPPTIADVFEQIELIKTTKTETDAWSLIYKAASRGLYHADEEFSKLPPECQSFVGSPSALKDLAQTDTGTLNTVVKGQFLKRVADIKAHKAVQDGLPAEVRRSIADSKARLEAGI